MYSLFCPVYLYEIVGFGAPTYDKPVCADHAHTKKPS